MQLSFKFDPLIGGGHQRSDDLATSPSTARDEEAQDKMGTFPQPDWVMLDTLGIAEEALEEYLLQIGWDDRAAEALGIPRPTVDDSLASDEEADGGAEQPIFYQLCGDGEESAYGPDHEQ